MIRQLNDKVHLSDHDEELVDGVEHVPGRLLQVPDRLDDDDRRPISFAGWRPRDPTGGIRCNGSPPDVAGSGTERRLAGGANTRLASAATSATGRRSHMTGAMWRRTECRTRSRVRKTGAMMRRTGSTLRETGSRMRRSGSNFLTDRPPKSPSPDLLAEDVLVRLEVPGAASVLAKLAPRVVDHGVPERPAALRALDDVYDGRPRECGAQGNQD